jgi:proteasome beta subunit
MYGVLEDQYKDDMTKGQALKVAAKALLASAQRDSASGNGMDLCVITLKDGFQMLSAAETESVVNSI